MLWAGSDGKGQRKELEGPLRVLTRAGWGMNGKNYWQRLNEFKLNSNKRRLERYAIFYIWKAVNGHVPSLGLEWNTVINRNGRTLKLPSMKGEAGIPKTMLRNSIKYGGVRLFNCMPEHIKNWEGSKVGFKKILDKCLKDSIKYQISFCG